MHEQWCMETTRRVIVLDAGHGGRQGAGKSSALGARGPSGTLEKDVTLAVARSVAQRLGSGAVLTREDDRNLTLSDRCERARRLGAGVFVSLHANSGAPGDRGTRTFAHPRSSAASRRLAEGIAAALGSDGGIELAELAALTPERHAPHTASCLVEMDYLTNPSVEARLRDPVEIERLGRAIASGIDRFCGPVALEIAHGLPNLTFGPPGPGGRPLGAVVFGSTPIQGSPVQIMWADYNESDTMAGSYWDSVWVTNAEGRVVWSDRIRATGLAAGGSEPHYGVWTPAAPGRYTAHVRLSSGEYAIPEDRMDDNDSEISGVVGSATYGVDAVPLATAAGAGRQARLGRGTLDRASNDPPRAGRYRAPASDVNSAAPFTLTQLYVPNNEVTFELAALGVEPSDPSPFEGPVDAEVKVSLSSTSDGALLGQYSVRIVDQQRGYITFTGSSADPIDTRCDFTVTVYNRIDPSRTLYLRMWTWT